jgi:hypothetical protein
VHLSGERQSLPKGQPLVAVSLPTLMHIHTTATACEATLRQPEWHNSEHLPNEHHADQPSLNYNLRNHLKREMGLNSISESSPYLTGNTSRLLCTDLPVNAK